MARKRKVTTDDDTRNKYCRNLFNVFFFLRFADRASQYLANLMHKSFVLQ